MRGGVLLEKIGLYLFLLNNFAMSYFFTNIVESYLG